MIFGGPGSWKKNKLKFDWHTGLFSSYPQAQISDDHAQKKDCQSIHHPSGIFGSLVGWASLISLLKNVHRHYSTWPGPNKQQKHHQSLIIKHVKCFQLDIENHLSKQKLILEIDISFKPTLFAVAARRSDHLVKESLSQACTHLVRKKHETWKLHHRNKLRRSGYIKFVHYI